MRFLCLLLPLSWCVVISSVAVPPSPAGGEYLRIYEPGDYAFAPDHDHFDITREKEGYTIEIWYYAERPLQDFDRAAVQPRELWDLIYKEGSYQIGLGESITAGFLGGTKSTALSGPEHPLPLNQWHYFAVTLSSEYIQKVYNHQLWGRRAGGFMSLGNRDSPFCIGGGKESRPFNGPDAPEWVGKPLWIPYTGGLIDEVRISNIVRYPRAQLDPGRWIDVIEVPEGRFEPDEHTLALWHFDFAGYVGSKWRDASGNGHHLTYKGTYQDVSLGGKLPLKWAELKRR